MTGAPADVPVRAPDAVGKAGVPLDLAILDTRVLELLALLLSGTIAVMLARGILSNDQHALHTRILLIAAAIYVVVAELIGC